MTADDHIRTVCAPHFLKLHLEECKLQQQNTINTVNSLGREYG